MFANVQYHEKGTAPHYHAEPREWVCELGLLGLIVGLIDVYKNEIKK